MSNENPRTGPLVSVVTPAYNQASFLRETIDSVLSQDYPHIEHHVIDDGSTDETPAILAEYNGRINWESQANMGQTPTINNGWQQSTGEIVTWLNSDDTFLPGAVSKGVEYLEKHPDVGIVFGDTLFTEADGTPTGRTGPQSEFDFERFVVGCENPIPQPSAFIRRSVVEAVGLLDPHFYYFMDWDFWLRAGLHCRIAYIPELMSTYRLHADSKTVAQSRKAAPELEYMYRKFFANPELPRRLRRLERKTFANMYFTTAGYYSKGGDRQAAARMGTRALKSYPALVSNPNMLHKLVFCWLGASNLYSGLRSLYRGRGPALATN